jgi:hypothetical protein
MAEILFFGCQTGHVGHFVFNAKMEHARGDLAERFRLNDGKLAPKDPAQKEGRAMLCWCDGYAVLAFWDRSVDSRLNSNAMFLVPYELMAPADRNREEVLRLAREAFPTVFARFGFAVEVVHEGMYGTWTAEHHKRVET